LHRSDPSFGADPDTSSFLLWPLATRASAEYRFLDGQLQRSKRLLAIRGLNDNHGQFAGRSQRLSISPRCQNQ